MSPDFFVTYVPGRSVMRSWLGQLKRSAQLLQKCRHVVVIGDPGDSTLPKDNDRGTTKAKGSTARSQLAVRGHCRPCLGALDDPFGRGGIAGGCDRTQRRAKIGGKDNSASNQLFDLSLSAGNVTTCDILM